MASRAQMPNGPSTVATYYYIIFMIYLPYARHI
ncbi:uncharacterized protein G2W53_044108 [Senna tora]|uniref:Uncharacterized protein n=1 Tax=Senna tora TaxID=362788 RepID=A0A834W0S4_9FABA|nr:uncharacterized protein G2W53_044108 [Senna tora]